MNIKAHSGRGGEGEFAEVGQQIELGVINHVRDANSEMIQTGTLGIEAPGDAIFCTVADKAKALATCC